MNFANALRRTAQRNPQRVALRHGDTSLTYAELVDHANRFAAYLLKKGVQPGDRVGVLMHNQPEWVIAMLGTWQAGACLVPYNYLIHPAALLHATTDADVQLIVTPSTDVERVRTALEGHPAAHHIVTTGSTPGIEGDGLVPWDQVMAVDPFDDVVPRLDQHDAILMYTSGSTGRPKGVRQTHRNIAAVCEATNDWWSINETDHALVCTPLFHVGGLQLITLPLLLAGGVVTLRRWKVREWLDDAVALTPTVVALVPAMMVDIVNELGDSTCPLPSIRVCAIGGSALSRQKLQQLTDVTGIVAVNIYGQTEQSGVSVSEPLDEPRREGSMGKPMRQIVEVRVVTTSEDGTLSDAGVNEPGELLVRGDAVTPGYWQLESSNADQFVDGWLRTSDLVRIDDDGYLYHVDRADDLIISGGENVFPQMVEGHLAACPLIAEVSVIGTHDERLSQQVTAIVVPSRPGVTAEDIAAYCEATPDLRGLQRPRRIEIVEAIPRTATNKIDRPQLKQIFT